MLQASLHGRLGKDAQTISTKTGTPMASASVAVDVSARDGEATVWVRVVAFGKAAETLAQHGKGETLSASGRLELSKWRGTDGAERESWQLLADHIHSPRTVSPGGRTGRGGGNDGVKRPANSRAARPNPAPDNQGSELPFNDDIPF